MKIIKKILMVMAAVWALLSFSLAAQAREENDMTVILPNPEHIEKVVYNGVSLPVEGTIYISPSWMAARQLTVTPKEGFQIDSWQLYHGGSLLNVGSLNNGSLEITVERGYYYAMLTVYTSQTGVEKPQSHITFELNDGAYEAVRNVWANGAQIDRNTWSDPDGFDVDRGAGVRIDIDTENYRIDLFELNGDATSNRLFEAVTDCTVKIDAHAYGSYTVFLSGNPDHFRLYTGTTESNRRLVEPEGFSLTVDEKTPYLWIERAPGFKLLSVTDREGNGIAQGERFSVTDRMTLNVQSAPLEYNSRLQVFVHNAALADEPELTTGDGLSFPLEEGYNEIIFAPEDNVVSLSAKNKSLFEGLNTAYLNGAPLKGNDFTWNFYYIPVNDGDVILLFVENEAELHPISIEAQTETPFKVLLHGVAETDTPESFEMHEGTSFAILPAGDKGISVCDADGAPAGEADENGRYTFTVSGPMSLTVKEGNLSGITGTEGTETQTGEIRTLDGLRIDRTENLRPNCIVIKNGKKRIFTR